MLAQLRKPRVLVAGVVVVLAAFALAYFTLFNSDSPSKLTLQTKGSTAATPSGDLAGTWTVADGSVAGYRVREKLAQLPAPSDAVGRTGAVTGQVTIADRGGAHSASNATFTVDVTQLKSDKTLRAKHDATCPCELIYARMIQPSMPGQVFENCTEGRSFKPDKFAGHGR